MKLSIHVRFLFFLIGITPIVMGIPYKITTHEGGFFSEFNTVLGALDAYDQKTHNCSGVVVDFEDKGYYYDPSLGNNWWNYYFEPLALNVHCQPQNLPTYKKFIFSMSTQFDMPRMRGYELIQKYVHIKPKIQKKVKEFSQKHFSGRYIVGVHYRGTDKHTEAPPVSYARMKEVLAQELTYRHDTLFFVATDDQNFLTFISKEFPGKIITTTAYRSMNGAAVHTSPHVPPYQKGEDALVDCLLLAHCNKMYKTASNLSDTAAKFNPYMPVEALNVSFFEV